MIVGIGIDAVEIERFMHWPEFSHERLMQIFGPGEISYALGVPVKAPERLAARFAAKEAAYKALASLMPIQITLMAFFKHIQVANDLYGAPSLLVDFAALNLPTSLKLSISISHTATLAMAFVIVENT